MFGRCQTVIEYKKSKHLIKFRKSGKDQTTGHVQTSQKIDLQTSHRNIKNKSRSLTIIR